MQKNQEMVGTSTSHPHLGRESRKTAGIILVVFPTVIYGGISLVTFLIDHSAGYVDNPARQNLFRAGHAHAGQDSSFRFCLLLPPAPNRLIYLSFAGALVLGASPIYSWRRPAANENRRTCCLT